MPKPCYYYRPKTLSGARWNFENKGGGNHRKPKIIIKPPWRLKENCSEGKNCTYTLFCLNSCTYNYKSDITKKIFLNQKIYKAAIETPIYTNLAHTALWGPITCVGGLQPPVILPPGASMPLGSGHLRAQTHTNTKFWLLLRESYYVPLTVLELAQ